MSTEVGKTYSTSVKINDETRERSDRLIELGLADTFSESVRRAFALAILYVERVGAPGMT